VPWWRVIPRTALGHKLFAISLAADAWVARR